MILYRLYIVTLCTTRVVEVEDVFPKKCYPWGRNIVDDTHNFVLLQRLQKCNQHSKMKKVRRLNKCTTHSGNHLDSIRLCQRNDGTNLMCNAFTRKLVSQLLQYNYL